MAFIKALRSPERFSVDLNRSDELPEVSSCANSDVCDFALGTVLKAATADFR
jgi:hypothetical protein